MNLQLKLGAATQQFPRLQGNIDPSNNGISPFVNVAKGNNSTSGFCTLKTSGGDLNGTAIFAAGRMDANYNLTDITDATEFDFYIFLSPTSLGTPPDLSGVSYTLTWDGTSVTNITVLSLTNLVKDIPGRSATFTFNGPATSNSQIKMTLGAGTPPTNIRVCKTSLVGSNQIMDPDFITFYSQYAVLRLMDLMVTNDSPAVDYADLPTTSFAYWQKNSVSNGLKVGIPVAAIIEIANLTGRPIHICVPHQFTDAAILALATALRDGITWTANEVRLYVEYSNEVWNNQFSQTTYCNNQGAAAGWTTGGATAKGRQWSGYRMAQVSGIFRSVFGTDSGVKWSGVLPTQAAAATVTNEMLVGVAHYISADAPSASVTKLFSHLAISSYPGPVPTTALSGIGQTMAGWANISQAVFNANLYAAVKFTGSIDSSYKNLDWVRDNWLTQKVLADAQGLGMMMYEGGYGAVCGNPLQDNLSGETQGPLMNQAFVDFGLSAFSGQIVYDMLTQFEADIPNGIGSQFVPVGANSKYGSWGAQQTFTLNSSPRALATKAFNVGDPYP